MRLTAIRAIFLITLIAIVARLGFWQILRADDLSAEAEEQRTQSAKIVAPRGEILFADGSVLASSKPTYLLFGQPKLINQRFAALAEGDSASSGLVEDFKQTFSRKLADSLVLSLDPLEATTPAEIADYKKNLADNVLRQLNKNLDWVSLGRTVDAETKKRLEALKLVGLGFQKTTSRFYPEGSASAHLLGFVGKDAYGNDKGYFGIEGFYNGELQGKDGTYVEERDAAGLPILIGKFLSKDPLPGKTITLNIDRTIQHIVEQKLRQGLDSYGAKSASAVVIDPKTGGVLAMAALPSYDPSHPQLYPVANFKNPITAEAYEPGSTFKVLVMAAAVNENLITADTTCDSCAGPVSIGGYTIRTWNNRYLPNLTMADVIIHSDNTGMVFVSRKLGVDKMYRYLQKFGLGKSTGIDVQDEFSPSLRPEKDWRDIDIATASFGQGISVTPLQVVRVVAAIANGGRLMEPHVAREVGGLDGVFEIRPKVVDEPITPQTAQILTQMMVRAVNEGEAKFARLPGYSIAGKTGTAQIPVAGHYDRSKTIASFVGFGPTQDPKFAMLVRFDEPTSSIYGAETAAPTFFAIAREILNYYGVPPSN